MQHSKLYVNSKIYMTKEKNCMNKFICFVCIAICVKVTTENFLRRFDLKPRIL